MFSYLLPTHDQVCKFTHLQVYKISSFQVCKIIFFTDYILIIKNFTISQIASACLQLWKIANLPNHQITIYEIYNYKVINFEICKFINCMCTFINFKIIELKDSQFKIIIINKIANSCLQICKITKLPKLQILWVHFCIFTSKCTCSTCMFLELHVLQNC
jgi:hypothetical protein